MYNIIARISDAIGGKKTVVAAPAPVPLSLPRSTVSVFYKPRSRVRRVTPTAAMPVGGPVLPKGTKCAGWRIGRTWYLLHDGRVQTASEWAREIGISPSKFFGRLKHFGPYVEAERLHRLIHRRLLGPVSCAWAQRRAGRPTLLWFPYLQRSSSNPGTLSRKSPSNRLSEPNLDRL